MKTFFLLLLSGPAFAYEQPRVKDPQTILAKLDHLISFKDTNLSLHSLNDVFLTRKLVSTSKVNFEGYGRYNLSRHDSESGIRAKLKW